VSREADLVLEREVAEAFAPFTAPRIHVDGNHDVDYLTVADNDSIFRRNAGHETRDIGDWRLVVWRADTRIHWPGTFALVDSDLEWLAETVRTADRPLVIAGHVPLSGQSQTGNFWFENNPQYATFPTVARVRAALREATVPVVSISGHVHWNSLTMVDGVAHLSLQSLTETFTTDGEASGAFGLLELSDRVLWRVHGADPFEWSGDRTRLSRKWKAPLPPFADMRRKR
ncbi:MAG: metallophosphoesterase, partial [Rhodospirillales bacterium]|nr:metallophosphoesterase [Rhodospirillales bacterium]